MTAFLPKAAIPLTPKYGRSSPFAYAKFQTYIHIDSIAERRSATSGFQRRNDDVI